MAEHSQYLEPRPEALEKIEHIVVLMLENRSFDNLLGWLYDKEKPLRGQRFEGLNEHLWNPLDNIDSNGHPFTEKVGVRKNGQPYKLGHTSIKAEENFHLPDPDPGEGYRDATHQLYGTYVVNDLYPPPPTGLGYVNNYKNAMLYGTFVYHDAPTDPREIMTCYTPEQVPVLSELAKQFAVLDQYFCSVPSQTLPNRDFIHAATSNGYVNNKPNNQVPAKTIYNQIQDAIDAGRKDLSWGIYNGTQNVNSHKHGAKPDWEPFSLTRLCMVQIQDKKYNPNFKLMNEFYKDAAAGNLPSYAFLEPQFSGPYQNDQHPPADIRPGEKLIADIYEALKNSPAWEKTLFVITYDEHGGCYDHFPPTATAKTPDEVSKHGQMGFRFNRFGVRVPTVVVSPLIAEGTIGRPAGFTPFDHTSIIKTVQNCFGLKGHLTERDKAAPDLSCLLTLDKPRTDAPEVCPLDYPPTKEILTNDLHILCAEILTGMVGKEIPTNVEVPDFIHDAYKDVFHDGKSSGDCH